MSDPADHRHILLARHGATEWSCAGRYQGQSDPPLSREGVAEVRQLALTLRGTPIGMVVTSPLQRALQTASRVASCLGLAMRVDSDLTELCYGAWEGLTQAEVKSRWPDLLSRWKHAPETVRFPGGETLEDVRFRVARSLASNKADLAGHSVLFVTHANWIRLALIEAQGLAYADFRRITVRTGSLRPILEEPFPPRF